MDHIREEDLNFTPFHCCGDEDLYPFRCPQCGRVMVFCYECDTLHGDLNDLNGTRWFEVNSFDFSRPIFTCPACGFEFEYSFMQNEKYWVTREQWLAAGFVNLLRE